MPECFPGYSAGATFLTLARGPAQVTPAQQVQVKVKDRLAGAGADVEDGAVAILDMPVVRQAGGYQVAVADDLGVFGRGFLQADDVLFGDDEQVRGRLRANVFEGQDAIVFVDFLGGEFPAQDAAEEA